MELNTLNFDSFLKMLVGDNLEMHEFSETVGNLTKGLLQKLQEVEPNEKMEDEKRRTKDLILKFPVSLEDLYRGKNKKVVVKRKHAYEQSDGSLKIVEERKTLVIPIKPGTKNNSRIVFPNEADEIPGFDRGDVIVIIKEQPHPVYERYYDDLLVTINISVSELYYFETTLKLLDGSYIKITKNSNDILSEHGFVRKIEGKGMPNEKNNGDLFVQFNLQHVYDVLPPKKELCALFPVMNQTKEEGESVQLCFLIDEDYYKLDLFEEEGDWKGKTV